MNLKAECRKKAKALDLETRRECVRMIWKGKKIGEIEKEMGVSSAEMVGILDLNIYTIKRLRLPEDVR